MEIVGAVAGVIGPLGVIVFMAFLVESLTEAVLGEPFNHIASLAPYKWVLKYAAWAVGIGGAFIYRFDLLNLSGILFEVPIEVTWFGKMLTGLLIGSGAQAVHDAIQKLKKPVLPEG